MNLTPGNDALSTEAPAASRVIAQLVEALASSGDPARAMEYVVAEPGREARFEVAVFRGSTRYPEQRAEGLDLALAMQAVREVEPEHDRLVEVTAISPNGVRRRVFERRASEGLTYLFPDNENFSGPELMRSEAVDDWARTMTAWGASPADRHPAGVGSGAMAPATVPPVLPARADLRVILTDALRDALDDVEVAVDLSTLDGVVGQAVQSAFSEHDRPAVTGAGADPERVAELVADRVAGRIADVLLPRLSAELAGLAGPDAEEVAQQVAYAVEPLLESIVDDHGSGGPPAHQPDYVAQATLVAISEQLHLQLESFADRVRSGSRSLESLADELSNRERAADAYTDRLAQSMDTGVERLARRLEAHLDSTGEIHERLDSTRRDLNTLIEAVRELVADRDAQKETTGARVTPLRRPQVPGNGQA